ncbi:hypothetical protein [Clostridiisalibacter paucivorans]|uniref:hypothetical protein n=1 Tax=Clostridiisalibacter paucivorans TaxID=408753 RepID=UPI00047EEF88|nr:hypothetical protein [Clostridiisalibacter paucivorans]
MKRTIVFVIIILLLSTAFIGCQRKELTGDEKIIKEYALMVKDNVEPLELIKYVDKNISKVNEKNADRLIMGIEKAKEFHIGRYTSIVFDKERQKKLIALFPNKFEYNRIEEIQDEGLKEAVVEMYNGGYKLQNIEGAYYPALDYEYLKKYNKYLSGEINDYIEIMAKESGEQAIIEGHRAVDWDELESRTINAENYINKYPEAVRRPVIGEVLFHYLKVYLLDDGKVDLENNTIKTEVIKEYEKVIENHPNMVTTEILKEYVDIVKKNNYKVTKDVENYEKTFYVKGLMDINKKFDLD